MAAGAVSDWYPYPFTDVTVHGYLRVGVNGVGVLALLLAVAVLANELDERLPDTVRSPAVRP